MSVSVESVRSRLLSNPLASLLSEAEIDLIIDHGEVLRFGCGEVVVREGEAGDGVYFIITGKLVVSKLFAGVCKRLSLLVAGQGFGEISLVSDEPRTATVTARCESVCLKLARETFDRLLVENGEFSQKMMRELTRRMISTERAASEQLLQSYQALIFSLSDLAESRDPETGAHLFRVQNYCRLLATLMSRTEQYRDRINQQFIDDIYVTSPLHDIGKVGIPDGVLLKPGRLSAQEFEIMKTHASLGAGTLEKVLAQLESSTFQIAYHVILHHHERYDGSGYPNGLKGEDISLEGRIMALADVYDALLSKRVYKEAFDYQTAKNIISEGRGQHFDPDITDLFLANIEQFEAIHGCYQDEPLEAEPL